MSISRNKPVTIKDIANRIGVSAQSVSMAVNGTGRLSPKMRAHILEIVREMNYVPNAAARSLTSHKSYLLGVAVPYLSRSFFSHILAGIEETAQEGRFALLAGNSEGGPDVEKRAVNLMLLHKVDGIITLPEPTLLDFYRGIERSGIPVIQIMQHIPELNRHYIEVDNLRGARQAVEHLLQAGHRKIGLLAHGSDIPTARLRIEGYFAAMKAAEIPAPYAHVDVKLDIDAAEKAATKLFAEHPELTALFCTSDYAALGAMRAAAKAGRRIPEELSVIGFDDMDFASLQVEKQLSSVAQPKEEIGRAAAAMMLQILRGEPVEPLLLQPELKLRESCRPCNIAAIRIPQEITSSTAGKFHL